MKLATMVFALIALLGIFARAQDSPQRLTADPLYEKNCAKCHGKTGQGRMLGGPALVGTKIKSASSDDLTRTITNGKGRMPKYSGKLSAEQIESLVKEIKEAN